MENRYYNEAFDIDNTADELFVQARNGYYDDNPAALDYIRNILNAEHKDDKAKLVDYMRSAVDEKDDSFSVSQMKLDMINGCGIEEVDVGTADNAIMMNITYDDESVAISLLTDTQSGGIHMSRDDFFGMTQDDFTKVINGAYFYSMEDIETEQER